MEAFGKQIVDDLRKGILAWGEPPNADSTKKKKGFNDPLVETGGAGVGRLARSFVARWFPAGGQAAVREAAVLYRESLKWNGKKMGGGD